MTLRHLLLAVQVAAIIGVSSAAWATPLKDGWRYRWGDPAPLADGKPGWTSPDFLGSLKPVGPDMEPPDRRGQDLLWLAIPVPASNLRDPTVYIDNANAAALEAWLGGERYFASGEIRPGRGEFTEEIGAHLIQLPKEVPGSTLLLRLQASNANFVKGVRLGEGRELTTQTLKRGLRGVASGMVGILMAVIVLVLWAGRRTQVEYLGLALFSASLGLVLIFQSNVPMVLFGSSRVFPVTMLVAAFYSVPGLVLFVARGISRKRRRWFELYGVAMLVLSTASALPLIFGGSIFTGLLPWIPFGIGGSLAATSITAAEAWSGNRSARLLLAGLGIIFATAVGESLSAVGIDEVRGVLALGVLGLTASLGVLLFERFGNLLRRSEEQVAQLSSREAEVKALSAHLEQGGHGLSEAIGVLKASLDAQSEVVQRQAGAIAETQVSATEVGQVSSRASQKANEVREVATRTESAGRAGGEGLTVMVGDLDVVRGEVAEMTRRIVGLGERARKLDEVVTAIEDLGDQTNVLAINANIEAARAGEQGKSFAIVAQEMRSLALQSAQAAGKIRKDLQSIASGVDDAAAISSSGLKKVEEVVSRAQASADHLKQIVELAVSTAGMAKEIATSVEQQHGGVGQMVEAIREFAIQAERLRQAMTDAESAGANVREVASVLLEAARRGGSISSQQG